MSNDFDIDRLAPETIPRVRVLPIVHEHIELAPVVRMVLDAIDPEIVAVELPTTLQEASIQAVRRLPKISLVVSEHPGEDALVWVVVPGDPMTEAVRWSIERGRPVACIDPDLPYTERHADPVPDPYALLQIGPVNYLGLLEEHYRKISTSSGQDRRREAGMAFHLRRLKDETPDATIVAVVGAAHVGEVRKLLVERQAHPFSRTRRASVELRHVVPGSLTGILRDSPLAHAVWERARSGDRPDHVEIDQTVSRKTSVVRFGLRVIQGEKGLDQSRRRLRLVDYVWSRCDLTRPGSLTVPDRDVLAQSIWKVASSSYFEQTGERTEIWQKRIFRDFVRRCARVQGRLVGGLYEWVVAARGVGDDNLAWEVFDTAQTYPWQEESAEIPSVDIEGSHLDLGTRKVRFRRRFFRVKQRPVRVPVRTRPQPDDPDEWLEAFDTAGLCSYPPEDIVIEDYGSFLQQKAISLMAQERRRVEPFATSLLDGIDIRETLQKFHEGRIYVAEKGRVPGEAGSVVVVFDRDLDNTRFPFMMTWLGEHDQESDMAFYATDPGDQVVGPGIMRATYGGFMLTQPRGRLFDVWGDRDYGFAHDRSEVLLMAAIDYSLEKIVVHVAVEAPNERMRKYAQDQRKIVRHVPLASLSPLTLRKIRVFHILAGRDKRSLALDYIW